MIKYHVTPPRIHSMPGVVCSPYDPLHVRHMRGGRRSSAHELLKLPQHVPIGTTMPLNYWLPKIMTMLGNDTNGCCVTSAAGFLKQCMGILISDATCIAWATKNGTLNGADLSQVNNLMQQSGFSQDSNLYNEGPANNVDYTTPSSLQGGIATSPVQIAIDADALPSGAGNGNGWYAFGGTPGSFPNTDHCVMLPAFAIPTVVQQLWTAFQQQYGSLPAIPWPAGAVYGIYTWAGIGFVDDPWIMSTVTEAHGYNSSNITVGTGTPSPDSVLTPTAPNPTPNPTPTPATGGPNAATVAAIQADPYFQSLFPGSATITPQTTLAQLLAIVGGSQPKKGQ